MPSKKPDTIWKAEPHTLAKIAILKAYLHAYFPILGRSKRGCPFLYVDGFAGPGEYVNSPEGSPIAALSAIQGTKTRLGSGWIAGDVTCVFIEPDRSRFEHLRGRVAPFEGIPGVKIALKQKSFEEGMAELRRELPKPFTCDDPLFVFIDPFGATGVPFKLIAEIFSSDCSEVLLNLDADGISRIIRAETNNNRDEQLTAIFGDESWRTSLQRQESFEMQCRRVLDLYKSRLRAIPNVRYVFAFEMRGPTDTLNYNLVFASRNALGLTKMKEAMKTIDQSGSYCFSDGGIGQDVLFRFDQPKDYADAFHKAFLGRDVRYDELNDYALNETPFINPKGMLKVLEFEGALAVKSTNPRRKRGEFKEETLISMTFLPRKPREAERSLFDGPT